MPRIRTIKPEFWSDEKLSLLPPIDRLVFLGLIGMADDFGRCYDNTKVIDAFIFPTTDDSSRESLATLSRINRIKRGKSSSGQPIIEIANWSRHQRVDHPQRKASLPEIAPDAIEQQVITAEIEIQETLTNDSRESRESLAHRPTTNDHGPTTNDQGARKRKPNSHTSLAFQSDLFKETWDRWVRHRIEKGKPIGEIESEQQNIALMRFEEREAIDVVAYSIQRGAANLITNGDHSRPRSTGEVKQKNKIPF